MIALRELLDDPRRIEDVSPSEAAAFLAEIASLQVAIAARLRASPAMGESAAPGPEGDRLLTAEDVAGRLNRSVAWVYRQSRHWPFARRLSRRTLRFSEAGLHRFLAARGRADYGAR